MVINMVKNIVKVIIGFAAMVICYKKYTDLTDWTVEAFLELINNKKADDAE